jgi:hypothetical protein
MDKRIKILIVFGETLGFALALLVVWMDEVADLPHLLFRTPRVSPRIEEALLESAFVLLVCAGVVASTIWLFRRIRRLESFIEMCAWCRRIKVDGRWISFESYLSEKNNLITTHGLCEQCAKEELKESGSMAA